MTALSQSAQANAAGQATVHIAVNKSGLQWAVAQMSVEARPQAVNGACTVLFNGNYYTSTATLPSTAGGQPAITLQAQDDLAFQFVGLAPGATGVVTIYYTETAWGEIPNVSVV
jgi:hypothetical protein